MWWAYAEAKKEDGELAAMQARTVRLPRTMPWDNVYAHVHFVIPYVKSRRLRDWDNLIASCKGFWDGLVRTGVLTDDNMDVIQRVSFSAEYKQGREAATLFELERIES
jgi:Holliday junction resolvase RusA-like endonuclease